MPTIKMNKKRFISLLGRRLPDDELAEEISMIGTDLEEINNEELIVEVFPNRPDMLSEEGFARAMRYFLEFEEDLKHYEVKESNYKAFLEEKALKQRPYVVSAVVKNVDFSKEAFDSLIQLQEKLHITHGRKRKSASIGVHDLDKISFPIYYKAVDSSYSFIPLGWDKKASIKEILEKHEKGKEYGYLIKEPYPVWEDAKGNTLALPPIINAQHTAISEKTRNFFIDVTGTNERAVKDLLNIVVTHLVELGGEVYAVEIDSKKYPDLTYKRKKVSLEYVNDLLGLNLNKELVEDLLLKMGMGFEDSSKDEFYALIPPYRTDILHPMDVVEDIAIAYGYNNFNATLPNIYTTANLSSSTKYKDVIRQILNGLGGFEIMSTHIDNELLFKEKISFDYDVIYVKNPMNTEYNVLRPAIFPQLLNALSKNVRYEYPQFIYEMGVVFSKKKPYEKNHLAVAYAGKDAGFDKIKAIFNTLFRDLGLNYKILEEDKDFFIDGRAVGVYLDDIYIGYYGEVHPKILENFEIAMPIVIGEVDLDEIIKKLEQTYKSTDD